MDKEENLRLLAQLVDEKRELDSEINALIATAREHGASWSRIGCALGTTYQAAQNRYRRLMAG